MQTSLPLPFAVGTTLYALTYDYARFADVFEVVELPIHEDSTYTFPAIVQKGYVGFIFPADDKNVPSLFTDDPARAYGFTQDQKEYVDKWYRGEEQQEPCKCDTCQAVWQETLKTN